MIRRDDLIRRSDAIEAIENTDWWHQNRYGTMVSGANSDEHQAWYKAEDVYKALESVPPVNRPQGEWIITEQDNGHKWTHRKCSECGKGIIEPLGVSGMNFCPNCGAMMKEGKL